MKVNQVLRQLRVEHNLTQEVLAEVLKITRQAYTRYESGSREPGFDVLEQLAKYYQYPMTIFFVDQSEDILLTDRNISELAILFEKKKIEFSRLLKLLNESGDRSDDKIEAQINIDLKRERSLIYILGLV